MRRKLALAVGGVTVLAGAQLASAGSALAVPGATLKTATASFDSTASGGETGTVQAVCPAGTKVIGGGATSIPATGKVRLIQMQPVQDSTGGRYVATAKADRTAGKYQLTAFAVCANNLPGLQIVSRTGAKSTSPFQLTGVACPAGEQVLGTGAAVKGGLGHVTIIEDSINTVTKTEMLAGAFADNTGLAGSWSLNSYAVCANPVPGYSIQQVASASNANPLKVATVTCPVGTTVHSGQAVISSANGEVLMTEGGAISADRRLVRATGTARPGSNTGNWSVIAFAVCAS
jgi:hypothetical protein